MLHSVVSEKISAENTLSGDEQRSLDMILWSLVDRCLAASDMEKAMQAFKMGTGGIFSPQTRLAFARRRHQFILEFGTSENSLIESGKELREIQSLLKHLSQEDAGGSEKGSTSGSGDTHDGKKERKMKNERPPPPPQQQNSSGQQNGGYYGGSNPNYGGQGGNNAYQQYPPISGGGGSSAPAHQQPPPQQPPPSQGSQQNYGGYNQNYQQGGYPPQQYQGWGYPQHQGNYNYNQQQWSGYNNYYGQR